MSNTLTSSKVDILQWHTASEYSQQDLSVTVTKFLEVTDLLLERPSLNSSHLFRADILFDSDGKFQTTVQKEQRCAIESSDVTAHHVESTTIQPPYGNEAPRFNGYKLQRTVVRRLIPRKPQLDDALVQSCHTYTTTDEDSSANPERLVVYIPHVDSKDDIPWYHPPVKALAYRYVSDQESATIAVCYLPLGPVSGAVATRLHRTFISLLQTIVRLTKLDAPERVPSSDSLESPKLLPSLRSTTASALRDTLIPQHLVQNTYTRLKQTYAVTLIDRWVEKTEPSKHVFEDLSIAAFLIELWRQMYQQRPFPGFVDIACGNGVLVYILVKEGYKGYGFDARRRKTWDVLEIDEHLKEMICIPKPFLDTTAPDEFADVAIHDGIFGSDTFIISNHADELTPWTPILAALSNLVSPLPFLAIPCCSHALSGASYRYTIKDVDAALDATDPNNHVSPTEASSSSSSSSNTSKPQPIQNNTDQTQTQDEDDHHHQEEESQPKTGDLKFLRRPRTTSPDSSKYSCLTRKTVALSEEIGYDTEMTLMRIPSTRNIGIVGGRKVIIRSQNNTNSTSELQSDEKNGDHSNKDIHQRISHLIERECIRSGGIESAAKVWIGRAEKLQNREKQNGRGKVNLRLFGGKQQ